jgi:hypothetical protein
MSAEGDPGPAENSRESAATAKPGSIAIEAETAELLAARAAALGITVTELIAALAGGMTAPSAAGKPAEGGQAARWREVKDWIDSWGKPGERPRPKLGE